MTGANDWQDIRNAVDRMDIDTAKSCLRLVLGRIRLLKEPFNQTALSEENISGLVELYDRPLTSGDSIVRWDPGAGCTHVHVVMGDSFAGGMKRALKELGWTDTHKMIVMSENYAIGPLRGLDSPEGRTKRNEWFRDHIAGAFGACPDAEEAYAGLLDRMNRIPENAAVILWASRSVREQTGLRHALHLLRAKPNPILAFDPCAICDRLAGRADDPAVCRRSGEITPARLKEALEKRFGKADGSAGPGNAGRLPKEDIARLSADWLSISARDGVLRIWRDGAVQEVPEDHFDRYLLETLDRIHPPAGDDGFVKCARLIGEAVGRSEQDIGDDYFEYRVRELVLQGVLDIRGVPLAGMRFYSVRRKR